MKIDAGTLFLGVSLFLRSIELISSQPPPEHEVLSSQSSPEHAENTTLLKLFPKSKGVHFPDIEEIGHADVTSIPNFTVLNGYHMSQEAPTYLKRGHVIFGYTVEDNIKDLGRLFDQPYLYAVFDTENHKWYILFFHEIKRLGVSRSLPLVIAHDEVHAVLHNIHYQENPKAHNEASEYAYVSASNYEANLRSLPSDHKERVRKLKNLYVERYNEVYQRHVGGPSERS